jgi:hypothetical protein
MRASKSSSIASRCYPDTVELMRGEQQKRLHGSPTREGAIVGPLVLVVVRDSVVPPVADTAEQQQDEQNDEQNPEPAH